MSINEETIATARNNKVVTNLGEWTECTKKILGVCINKVVHYPYCVWPSKLARMIQDQGMAQIGQPITTDCRGFKLNAPNEIQMVDFSKIDLSEYFSDVVDKLNATALLLQMHLLIKPNPLCQRWLTSSMNDIRTMEDESFYILFVGCFKFFGISKYPTTKQQ